MGGGSERSVGSYASIAPVAYSKFVFIAESASEKLARDFLGQETSVIFGKRFPYT